MVLSPPVTDSEYRLFYRVVKSDPPTLEDFLSSEARGHPPPDDRSRRAVWDGISVFSTEAQARRKARVSPALGGYVAALYVVDGGPVRYKRTLGGDGHHTLWGTPSTLLGLVVSVAPIG
jgi:hypothetical protein